MIRIHPNRRHLPIGTKGRMCGHDFVLIGRGSRLSSGAWEAAVRLDTGETERAFFVDAVVTEIPKRNTPKPEL